MADRSVLIVDDEIYIRMTLSFALEKLNFSVDTAASGTEALKKLAERSYAVMLLDLRIPGMDGMEVLKRVPEIRPEVKVVIITAYGSVEAAVEAMKLGAVDFLQKPFDPEEVRKLVSSLLDQSSQETSRDREYEGYLELASKRIGKGEFDAARVYAHKAISINSNRPEAYNLLGGLYEARSNRLEAEKNYRVALALTPSYQPAQKNLDRITSRPYTPLGIDWGFQATEERRRS
ncbi:MAG: response regulator [Deltaproteobacteria bacterium]|nr:MAG: response regulator [Deltaproteobacteria bacterium]